MAQEIDSSAALWQNISALMKKHYGRENLGRLADDCGFAKSTATRIKQQKTATGLDKIDLIAHRFGLASWQLLVPGLDPDTPPALQPVNERERLFYERIMSAVKGIAAEPDSEKFIKPDHLATNNTKRGA